ncbi:MAG: hypothetical protein ACH346_08455, partial [Chthoniobacterales bacterium]
MQNKTVTSVLLNTKIPVSYSPVIFRRWYELREVLDKAKNAFRTIRLKLEDPGFFSGCDQHMRVLAALAERAQTILKDVVTTTSNENETATELVYSKIVPHESDKLLITEGSAIEQKLEQERLEIDSTNKGIKKELKE